MPSGIYTRTHIVSEETKRKMSLSRSGNRNPNYGKIFSEEYRKKLSEAHKGYKMPEDQKRKIKLSNIGKHNGDKHPNWKGGISEENHRIRNSTEYKEWRMSVFQRDRFSCVKCKYRSVVRKDIRADHIKPFSLYPNLRFELKNGRTLCISCDRKYGWNLNKGNEYWGKNEHLKLSKK